MISATSMAVLLHLIVFLISLFASPATADPLSYSCGTNTGNFISNSTYSFNLKHLLSNLSSNASATGFATYTTGSIPDRVHGLALCRGDINTDSCRSCISLAVPDIQHLCPNNNSAIIWYDYCQLRYSKQDFLYAPDVSSNIMLYMFNNQDVSAKLLPQFESLTPALIGNLSDLAVRNTSRLFATGETVLTAGYTIYGLVQCARDLSDRQCRKCLQGTEDATTRDPLIAVATATTVNTVATVATVAIVATVATNTNAKCYPLSGEFSYWRKQYSRHCSGNHHSCNSCTCAHCLGHSN